MEQKDYLLREIEKIGVIMNAIRQKVFGGGGKVSLTLENQVENENGQLLSEVNFDLDRFLDLNIEESNEFLCSEGFSDEKIELLAECFFDSGFSDQCSSPQKYLEKALQLYILCNLKSKTYSMKRERNITVLKNALQF